MAPRRSARKASDGKAALDLTLSCSPSPSSDVEVQDAPHRRSSPRKKTKTTTAMEDADEAFARALQDEENAAAAAAAMDQGAPAAGTSKANQSNRAEEAAAMKSTLSGNALAEASTSTSEVTPVDKDDSQAIVGAFRSLFVDGTGCQKCDAAGLPNPNDNKTASKQSAVSGFVARLSSLWTIATLFNSVGDLERRPGRWTRWSDFLLDHDRKARILTRVRSALVTQDGKAPFAPRATLTADSTLQDFLDLTSARCETCETDICRGCGSAFGSSDNGGEASTKGECCAEGRVIALFEVCYSRGLFFSGFERKKPDQNSPPAAPRFARRHLHPRPLATSLLAGGRRRISAEEAQARRSERPRRRNGVRLRRRRWTLWLRRSRFCGG